MIRNSIVLILSLILLGEVYCCKAQTLNELEKYLSEKIAPFPPPPPRCHLQEFWDDSWDEWSDYGVRYIGCSYNYSRQYPFSFSLFFHQKLIYAGLDVGFATNGQRHDINVSEINGRNIEILNGEFVQDETIESITHYSVNPFGYFAIQPGININFISFSCGFGINWGKYVRDISSSRLEELVRESTGTYSQTTIFGCLLYPNVILHIPVVGTRNRVHINVNGGYQFISAFHSNDIVRKLATNGNGWKFGAGIEFQLDW